MRLTAHQRGYTGKWHRARKQYLKKNPLCVWCKKEGFIRLAYAVDHIVPHKGNSVLMWDQDNWQSLCRDCHNRRKQNKEKRGYDKDLDSQGYPLDPDHPIYKTT